MKRKKYTVRLSPFLIAMCCLVLFSCELQSDVKRIKTIKGNIYIGEIRNNKPDGYGVISDGETTHYEGQWKQGQRNGWGKTDSTIGQWRADTMQWGTLINKEMVYQGETNHHIQPQGHGVAVLRNGHRYEGRWENGKREGFGFSLSPTNLRVGEWTNDKYRGERLRYTSERIYGIDLSKHQHEKGKRRYKIDWAKLRIVHLGKLSKKRIAGKVDYPVSFLFIKSTEGRTVRNKYYAADHRAARAHGLPVGAYHFFSTTSTGKQQALWFLRNTKISVGDLPPVLDLEPLPSQIRAMGGSAALWKQVRLWLQTVEHATGSRPILYISQQFVNRYLPLAPDVMQKYEVWIARYGEYKPEVHLRFWQLAPDGRVAGIHGEVDINVFNGYAHEFQSFLKQRKMR